MSRRIVACFPLSSLSDRRAGEAVSYPLDVVVQCCSKFSCQLIDFLLILLGQQLIAQLVNPGVHHGICIHRDRQILLSLILLHPTVNTGYDTESVAGGNYMRRLPIRGIALIDVRQGGF